MIERWHQAYRAGEVMLYQFTQAEPDAGTRDTDVLAAAERGP